jgi:hypothetical protein
VPEHFERCFGDDRDRCRVEEFLDVGAGERRSDDDAPEASTTSLLVPLIPFPRV